MHRHHPAAFYRYRTFSFCRHLATALSPVREAVIPSHVCSDFKLKLTFFFFKSNELPVSDVNVEQ